MAFGCEGLPLCAQSVLQRSTQHTLFKTGKWHCTAVKVHKRAQCLHTRKSSFSQKGRAQCLKNHNFAVSCGTGRTCGPHCRTVRLNFWNPPKGHCSGGHAMPDGTKVTKCCFLKTTSLTGEKRALFPLGAVLTLKSVINLGTCAFNF